MIIQILDVLIGLCVVFLIFSTVASAAIELIEIVVRRRSRMLLDGIREIFRAAGNRSPATVESLVRSFYRLAPIASQYVGDLAPGPVEARNLPSYLSPERFAIAIINAGDTDVASRVDPNDRAALAAAAGQILAVALKLYTVSGQNADTASIRTKRAALVKFFKDNGDRMSGWYRRHVQVLLLGVGFLLAIAFNVNTLTIVKTLSEDDALRARIVNQALAEMGTTAPLGYAIECTLESGVKTSDAHAQNPASAPDASPQDPATQADGQQPQASPRDTAQCERELRDGIKRRLGYAHALGLPIGWREDALPSAPALSATWAWGWVAMLLGWALTALAICIGAPFWFDAIGRLVNLRTALKPNGDPVPSDPAPKPLFPSPSPPSPSPSPPPSLAPQPPQPAPPRKPA